MHQQVRTSTRRRPSSDGPGAMADRGGLVDILRTLRDKDLSLRAAGGRDLDRGGEFVFSVHHGTNPDGSPDDGPTERAVELLQDYGAKAYEIHYCLLEDRPGTLLECVEQTVAEQGDIFSILVGASEKDGRVPVQIRTRRMEAEYSTD